MIVLIKLIMAFALSSLGYLQELQSDYLGRYIEGLEITEEQFLAGAEGDPEEHADLLVDIDPVSWCELNLEEKDGTPWELWDYQKDILRYQGSQKLLSCGAETGKTRSIVGEALWRAVVYGQEVAIVSAAGIQIQLIWAELERQLELPHLAGSLKEKRKAPLHEAHFNNGGAIVAQTAGGVTRGIHVDCVLVDEAADILDPQSWSDILSRVRPGGTLAVYSTPRYLNGKFYEMVQGKADGDKEFKQRPELVDPLFWPLLAVDGWSRDDVAEAWVEFRETHKIPGLLGQHWSKKLAPKPYYSKSREREFQRDHGPPDSTLYLINVEGRCAPPVDGVFPSRFLLRSLDGIEDYREIAINDASNDECIYRCSRLNPDYGTGLGDDYLGQILEGDWEHVKKTKTTHDPEEYRKSVTRRWTPILKELTQSIAWEGSRIAGGADMARDGNDPTEILFFDVIEERYVPKLRVTLRSFANNPEQAGIIHALIGALPSGRHHWGFDAGGAVGSDLKPWMPRAFTPIYFQHKIPEFNPINGKKLAGSHEIRIKKGSTDVLNRRLADDRIVLPRSNKILEQFANHRYRKTPSGEVGYARENDHLIDATRIALYQDLLAFPPKTIPINPESAKKHAPISKRAKARKKRHGRA